MNKKPLVPRAPPSAERHWQDLVLDPHRAMLARMARWELPAAQRQQLLQASRDDHRVQIGSGAGEVNVTHSVQHIGSQVNHITQAAKLRKPKPPGLLDHDDAGAPTSWPELLRASVWGGL